jgi:hypothetical protein
MLDETGLHKKNRLFASKSEEDIYKALDLPFIPPELCEIGSEVERAAAGELPELVTGADLRGVLHAPHGRIRRRRYVERHGRRDPRARLPTRTKYWASRAARCARSSAGPAARRWT